MPSQHVGCGAVCFLTRALLQGGRLGPLGQGRARAGYRGCSRPQPPPSPLASTLPVPGQSPAVLRPCYAGLSTPTPGGLAVSSPLRACGMWVSAVACASGNQSPDPMRQDILACLDLAGETMVGGSGAFPSAWFVLQLCQAEGSCGMGCVDMWAVGCSPAALWGPGHPILGLPDLGTLLD